VNIKQQFDEIKEMAYAPTFYPQCEVDDCTNEAVSTWKYVDDEGDLYMTDRCELHPRGDGYVECDL